LLRRLSTSACWLSTRKLVELGRLDPEAAAVVEMRYFGGYSEARTAELLDITPAQVKDHFTFAKAWLRQRMVGE
jgi:DNA-directed RNA polymerase specialized sigma24 family protein